MEIVNEGHCNMMSLTETIGQDDARSEPAIRAGL